MRLSVGELVRRRSPKGDGGCSLDLMGSFPQGFAVSVAIPINTTIMCAENP